MLAVVSEKAQDSIAAQYHQTAAQLRLKDDEQAEQHGRQQVIENAAQNGQIEAGDDDLSDEKQADDDETQAAHDTRAARPPQETQDEVDRHAEDGDLDQIACADRFVKLGQPFLQVKFSPCSRACRV